MAIKVLYVGYFHEGTGWSQAAINMVLALDSVGVDVSVRSIKLNNKNPKVPDRIIELEHKKCKWPDVVIQHVLPHHLDYNGYISKNVCLYATETTHFKQSSWPQHINTMDSAWVFCEQSKQASIASGVTIPIRVVQQAVDIKKFNKSYEALPLKKEFADKFIFYTIGEFNRRKNMAVLLKAFHTEFRPEEPVELLIKTSSVAPEQINTFCSDVKKNLRIYPKISDYKKEIIILDYWSDNHIMRLHSTCDCFVSPSYGETTCLPAIDGMGMGKAVICSDFGGFKEYVSDETGWPIPGRLEPVFGQADTFPNLFTSREEWFSIDQLALQGAMREAYENKLLRNEKAAAGIKKIQQFSYENVGQKMKTLLLENS